MIFLSKLAREAKLLLPSQVIKTASELELSLIVFLELIQVPKEELVSGVMVVEGSSYPNLLANLQLAQICY